MPAWNHRDEGGTTIVEMTLNGKRPPERSWLPPPEVSRYFARKEWLIRIVGAVLLALASPLILVLVWIVRLTSPGPGLYWQARAGRHGRLFMMYKIRTMYLDAEKLSGPVWCKPGDSRITPVGKFLRFLHLDELPQLINVARGEMDLVGPRPERPCFIAWLADEIPNYTDRLLVLPGVTGLAQVNLPPDEGLDCVRKKIVLDCDYITSANVWLDLRIVICSFLRMFGIRHGRAVRWLGLERALDAPANREEEVDEQVDGWSSASPEPVTYELSAIGHGNEVAMHVRSNGHADQNGDAIAAHNGTSGHSSGHKPR